MGVSQLGQKVAYLKGKLGKKNSKGNGASSGSTPTFTGTCNNCGIAEHKWADCRKPRGGAAGKQGNSGGARARSAST